MNFCGECGAQLERICPKCLFSNPSQFKFCGQCGQTLAPSSATERIHTEPKGERKHVSVLFSDLCGYTAMAEKLDPEEVKDITRVIFGEIAKITAKYNGFIEKYAGDAVMALFGVPEAHEDDPIRAIKAAREIHQTVDALSTELESKIGEPVSMHSGINTGLVVTGEVAMEQGTHGVAGDTINLASRFCSLAKSGEILVDVNTYHRAEGHFTFEGLKFARIKGKAEPVQIYRILSQREKPITTRRLSGLRADLIGREAELAELRDGIENLRNNQGGVFTICGDAGTGKSRLIEELKASLDLEEIQWLEGHAYAYSQNIPYFPLIHLLNRILRIKENDPSETVREKIVSGIEQIVGKRKDVVPYAGSLYSLHYPETENISPEYWRANLHRAIRMILEALAKRAPTVFLFEDLHWADPSFVELLRRVCQEILQPVIFICTHRPTFSLLPSPHVNGIRQIYHEIRLEDLSLTGAQKMMESLLKTESIPSDLKRAVQNKAEGNPFYLEELINSLIESNTLIRVNGNWKITKTLCDSDISPSIYGLISGRIDRLENRTKQILQEASVIGRTFLYEILVRITAQRDDIDSELNMLERLDLIRTRSLQPDLEYMFKHPLTQEVVYSGLLKKERKEIHEQIACVIESLFPDRLAEFYETLAFHLKQSNSILKAVDYLMKSGEKSVRRYAVEESHQYYLEAYEILLNHPDRSKQDKALFVDMLIKWAYVFYYRGDFNGLTKLFSAHEDIADSLDDKAKKGMFNGWLGFGHFMAGAVGTSFRYLHKALELGEAAEDQHVIAYACTWLTWCCVDLGLSEEAIKFGERAHNIAESLNDDHYLYFKPLAGIACAYYAKGDWKEAIKVGETLIAYGLKHSNIRSVSMGYTAVGQGHAAAGDLISAVESYQEAINVAADPVYELWAKCWLWPTQLNIGKATEATDTLQEIINFSESFGYGAIGLPAYAGLGVITAMNGRLSLGVGSLEDAVKLSIENGRKPFQAIFEHLLGKIYLQLVENKDPVNLSMIAKNIGFLVKNVTFAHKKAESHFNKAIEIFTKMGAKNFLAQAYLDLGLLHKAKNRPYKAKACISDAIKIFEQCEAEIFLKQAKEIFASLA